MHRLFRTGLRFGLLLLLGMATACGRDTDARTAESNDAPVRERRFSTSNLSLLWRIGGGEADTTLLRPRLLIPGSDGDLYVVDDGRSAVLAFDSAGARKWIVGGRGGGPNEFQAIRDAELDGDGNLWVLDAGNTRIAVLSPDGAFVRRVPLGAVGHAEQVAPLTGSRAVLMTMGGDSPFVIVDSVGAVQGRFGVAWDGFADLDPLARQGYTTAGPGGWAFVFTRGDGWFLFDDQAHPVGGLREYVEHLPFPEVREMREGKTVTTELASYAPCSACSASMGDSLLYVHFGGLTDDSRRVVDLYGARDGAYLRSLRLSAPVSKVAATRDLLYTLQQDSLTLITAYRISTR